MIKNYLKIAFRSLWRNGTHSFINIFGLTIGIACCILIMLYVKDEWTFDTFHKKADRIYRVFVNEDWGKDQQFFYTTSPFPMGPTLKENLGEVEHQVRINPVGAQVKIDEEQFSERILVAGKDFYKVFDFKSVDGNSDQTMQSQTGVVITKKMAQKYFGDGNAINKVISIQLNDAFEEYTVGAVVEDMPTNSSIRFDLMISDLNFPKLFSEQVLNEAWFNISPETYVLLREDTKPEQVVAKFPDLFRTVLGANEFKDSQYSPGLQPFLSIHLDTSFPPGNVPVSDPKYSYILAAIAVLILCVACINFITLSVGRSLKRSKEVGIRKVVGAMRSQLIAQFMGEAVLVTMISVAIGIGAALLLLPFFNDLAAKQLAFPFDGFLLIVVIGLLVVIGLVSGSYPALVLSGFKPIAILKGGLKIGNNKQTIRKGLVTIQLVFSIFLISSSLIMQKQLRFLQNKNLGFTKEQVMVLNIPAARDGRLTERISAGFEKSVVLKSELTKNTEVIGVATSAHDFATGAWTNVGYTDDNGAYREFNINVVDADYVPVMGMEIVAGRNFDAGILSDTRRGMIVNEAFVKEYGWGDPIGKRIPGKNLPDHEIVGVVKDFHYASLYTHVEPLAMVQDVSIVLKGIENINVQSSPMPKLLVRLQAGNVHTAVDKIKAVWPALTGMEEFDFSFVDEAINQYYRNDKTLGGIVAIATILAILIGSLGLYGLASLSLQNRTKEISIRKVMGATEQSLLILLSKEYFYLVVISLVISVPITLYLMNSWLASFQYRIKMGVGIFLLAGAIGLVIAFLTIFYQALKTTSASPAETLKYE